MWLIEDAMLPAAPDAVWAVISDWERQASWMPDVSWVRVLGRERGRRARLAIRTKLLGVPLVTDRAAVTAWEPPSRLAISREGLVRGSGEWRLDALPGGRTRFTWAEDLRLFPPILGELALRVYSPWQRRMLRGSLANLARIVGGAQPAEET